MQNYSAAVDVTAPAGLASHWPNINGSWYPTIRYYDEDLITRPKLPRLSCSHNKTRCSLEILYCRSGSSLVYLYSLTGAEQRIPWVNCIILAHISHALPSGTPCCPWTNPCGLGSYKNISFPGRVLLEANKPRRVSVVRTSVFGWRTFPDLRLIYGWHVTTSCVKCPLWVNQLG